MTTVPETSMTFKYDSMDDSWREWMFIHLITGNPDAENAAFDTQDSKDKIHTFDIAVNGVPVDAKRFFERLFENYEWAVDRGIATEATKRLNAVAGFGNLNDAIHDMTSKVQEILLHNLRDAGINVNYDDLHY